MSAATKGVVQDARQACVMFISCIGAAPKYFMQLSDDFRHKYRVIPFLFNDVERLPDMFGPVQDALHAEPILIYHEPDWMPYLGRHLDKYEEFLNSIPDGVAKISVPQPDFLPLWPFHSGDWRNSQHDRKANRYGELPSYSYGDSYVLRLLKEEVPPDEVISRYLRLDIPTQVDLDSLLRASVSRLERQDRGSTVKVTNFIVDTFRSKALFQTINHANNRLNLYMANQVLMRLGCATVSETALEAVTEIIERQTPVHPGIASHFGLSYIDGETRYPVDDVRNLTFSEYIRDYVYYEFGTLNYTDGLVNNPGVPFRTAAGRKEEGIDATAAKNLDAANSPTDVSTTVKAAAPSTYITIAADRNKMRLRSDNMPEVKYLEGHIVSCGGRRFYLDTPDHRARAQANPQELLMFKSPGNIMVYEDIKQELGTVKNIVELGIAWGGSAVFIDAFFQPQRLVCLDLRTGIPPALQTYLDEGNSSIRAYPGVDQADRAKLDRVLREDFDGLVDLIVDDASHLYGTTKSTFEILFPRLRPNGIYVIEDWDWFHSEAAQIPMHHAWTEPSLTNLAMELMVAHASYPALISKLTAQHRVLWVQRGGMQVDPNGFSLSRFLNLRGRTLAAL